MSDLYAIKDQSDYLPGYIATGLMAIAQTVTPLMVYQLWKKNDLTMDTGNMWYQYSWKAMQAGGVVCFGL